MSVQSPGVEVEEGLGVPAAYGEGLATDAAGLGTLVAAGVTVGVTVGVTPGGVAAGVLRTPVSWTTGDLEGPWGLGDGEAIPGEVTGGVDAPGEVTDGEASPGEVTDGEAAPGELEAVGLTPGEGSAGEGEDRVGVPDPGVGLGAGEVPGGQRLQVAAQ